MKPISHLLATLTVAAAVCFVDCDPANAAGSKIDVKDKIVLANVDKHAATFRLGKTMKHVAPRKASVLTPKTFPFKFELWDGKPVGAKWVEQQIPSAGIYLFRFENGAWKLRKKSPTKTSKAAAAPAPNRTPPPRTSVYKRPTYRRATGTAQRVVRGAGRVYRGSRFPVLYRVTSGLLSLYRFVRDEEDRDLIRSIIIGDEIDREIERELWDRLDDLAVNLPALDRLEFERTLRDLRNLDEADLDDLRDATDEDWSLVRDELGDEVSDNAWREIEGDYGDLDAETLPADEVDGLDDVAIDSLESDVDFEDLDTSDVGVGDLAGTLDDVDFGDLSGGIEDIDVGDLGSDLGLNSGFGGPASGGFGGGLEGGFGGEGGFGSDGGFGSGGGFGYDQGGYNDFQNNMNGGDWGGDSFDAPAYGGFGGDYGGGDFGGGDFGGGGFDDFGGGGFDDFGGGGFDDFGGGFDDF